MSACVLSSQAAAAARNADSTTSSVARHTVWSCSVARHSLLLVCSRQSCFGFTGVGGWVSSSAAIPHLAVEWPPRSVTTVTAVVPPCVNGRGTLHRRPAYRVGNPNLLVCRSLTTTTITVATCYFSRCHHHPSLPSPTYPYLPAHDWDGAILLSWMKTSLAMSLRCSEESEPLRGVAASVLARARCRHVRLQLMDSST
jgi:hypothetical protein